MPKDRSKTSRGGFTFDGQYIMDNSIVGTIEKDSFDRGWWAYGCRDDWQDVKLGLHSTERKAKREVERWVRENA